jgi:hypothetical protein
LQPFLNLAKKKINFALDQPLQNFPYKEMQLNSTGIKYELKGWMSNDALQHVCTGHNMTQPT